MMEECDIIGVVTELMVGNRSGSWYDETCTPTAYNSEHLHPHTFRLTSSFNQLLISKSLHGLFLVPGVGPWRPAMAPYVDEQINRGPPGGLVGLGLEWHTKLLFRFEQASTPINPYGTVRVVRRKFTPGDAIGSCACSREALASV
jgi:hypothetical protein